MSKKTALIVLTVDDEATPGPSVTHSRGFGNNHFMFEIDVRRDDLNPDAPLIGIAAHELGHVLQGIFSTEAALLDARRNQTGDVNPDESIVTCEKEAWDLAHQMVGKENCPTENVDLSSYIVGARSAEQKGNAGKPTHEEYLGWDL